ncbi:MAG: PilZ domain-containing protein [Marinobacter sp.]|uniref:PilZ domain-containing protein n=1 Tax=Marinobacter sp. TaxID=50741 RepID=UPI00299E2CE6|nr:PilZ domain-containing protein [Marinobacter sp.]MDX1633113.1 PilZ domain-containing protein [Marinobacter sp.]
MSQQDYSFGAEDPLGVDHDQRTEFRLTGRATLLLELESPEPGEPPAPGARLVCHTHDLSVSGARVFTDQVLPVGALLPVTITLAGAGGSHELMVDVIWCEPREGRWASGLKVIPSDDSSYIDWVDAMARAMVQD